MENNWKEFLIEDLCSIRRGASPRPIKDFIKPDGVIPWVKISDATASDSRYITRTGDKIIELGRNKSVEVTKGDLILSNSATPGLPKIMKIDACIHDGWLLLREFKGILKEYMYYLLINERERIVGYANGTVFQNLKTDILRKFKVKIPEIEEQRKIVSILSSLDDKIELNNEMNKTLEEIAQAIFKSWFVDFEPFKGGGFEESELGMIPKEWKTKELKSICQINMGQSPSSETYNDESNGLPFYQGIRDFTERFPLVTTYCSDPKKVAEKGDILLSVRAPVGSLNIAIESCCIGRGVASIKSELYGNNFIYYLLKNIKWNRYESGTVFSSIKKSDIQNYKIIVPSMDVIKRFNKLVKPLDNSIYNNSMENIELRQIRDALLPKLISGEIKL
ncbi:restriction endonuclease subunit S [Clostridium sp. 001]|uniref:restriction endonuclease subunit S n=1 Tax=Clostridium sp. 001 TaxID=1970093 RepID=UPI001C2C1B14|nr:restriction endonuclease subunit S [Clostridium sp. 001]